MKFIDIPIIDLAQQLALMIHELIIKVNPYELLYKSWTRSNKNLISPNVRKIIHHTNQLHSMICTSIIKETDLNKRVNLISYFIDVADAAYSITYDFDTLVTIMSVFDSVSVHRLKDTWKKMDKKHEEKFIYLRSLTSQFNDMKSIRQAHDNINKNIAYIPYFGLWVRDMFKLEDIYADYIKLDDIPQIFHKKSSSKIAKNKDIKLIHFRKLRLLFEKIVDLKECQKFKLSYTKDLLIQQMIKYKIRYDTLSDAELYNYSLIIQPKKSLIKKKKLTPKSSSSSLSTTTTTATTLNTNS